MLIFSNSTSSAVTSRWFSRSSVATVSFSFSFFFFSLYIYRYHDQAIAYETQLQWTPGGGNMTQTIEVYKIQWLQIWNALFSMWKSHIYSIYKFTTFTSGLLLFDLQKFKVLFVWTSFAFHRAGQSLLTSCSFFLSFLFFLFLMGFLLHALWVAT